MADNTVLLPPIVKCPEGEEWPQPLFRYFITGTAPKQTMRTIHITCPEHHWYSLAEAVKAGTFTEEQAEKIVAQARERHENYKAAPLKTIMEDRDMEASLNAVQKARRRRKHGSNTTGTA